MIMDAGFESTAEARLWIEKAGMRVVEWARTGSGWVAPWQKAKPDLIVIDLQLPKRDGLYCLSRIRELDPAARVLFTHGYVGICANEVEMQALSLGASAVLQRPCPQSRFQAALLGALKVRGRT